MALESLLWALVFLIFLLSNALVGFLLYKLGLHGRVFRLMEEVDAPSEKKPSTKLKEPPAVIPGEEFNPFINRYDPMSWENLGANAHPDDEDYDDFEDVEQTTWAEDEDGDYVDDPVVPTRKNKVVMTSGEQDSEA